MKHIFVILFLLKVACSLQASDSYYYFKQISIKEGLPSYVTSIYDDENGFLWVGTNYGVYRFDGEKLTKVRVSNSQQTSSYIYELLGDNAGHIWMFTGQSTNLYNSQTANLEPFLLNGLPIQSYTVHSDEKHIVFPVQGALLRYDKQLQGCTRLPLSPDGKQVVILKLDIYDAKHYIGLTDKQRLVLVDRTTGVVGAAPFDINDPVRDFYRDTRNRYWISFYGKGIACYTPQGKLLDLYTPQNSDLNNAAILDIEERNEQLWLATDGGGINIIDPASRRVTILSNQGNNHFPANSVTCLNNGVNNMWIGMVREGVLGAKENFITTYSKSPRNDPTGMSEKCPLCLLEDADGTIWIGTDGGGVNRFDPRTETFTHYPATAGDKIVSLCAYTPDELLISNYLTGMHLFDKRTGACRKFTVTDDAVDRSITGTSVPTNLFVNERNEIEFHGRANYRYDRQTNRFTPFHLPQGDYYGPWLFIGMYRSKPYYYTRNCVLCYNYGTNQTEVVYDNNSQNIIAACLSSAGEVWIANRNNLCRFSIDTKQTEVVKLPDNNDLVTSLIIDREGTIWMGTPGALYAYSPVENHFVIFSESDGVLPNDFLPKPVLITRDDNIYMGGAMGLVRVNKALNHHQEPYDKLRIRLLDIQLDGNNASARHGHDTPSLEVAVGFASLEIHTKLDGTDLFRKRIYRYRIEGLNGDYIESSKSYLRLPTLSPGRYTIHVECTLANGLWSESFALLELTVQPPWWQRTWFIVLIVLLVISGLAYVIRLREVRIQNDLKEKERQIYKDKVQVLININHELRTPLTLIYSPLKQLLGSKQMPYELRSKLQGVLKQTRQMKNIINMILHIRRMEVGENTLCLVPTPLNEWLQAIIDDFRSEFEMRNISLLFHADPQIETLSLDTNQCEIVLSNLLMNAYKFSSPGSTVTVATHLEEASGSVRIAICDEGIGISDEDPVKLFTRFQRGNHTIEGHGIGLSYAKQLVEMHGGQIMAANNETRGATFSFTLPIRRELERVTCPVRPYLNEFLPSNALMAQSVPPEQLVKFHSILIVESDPDLCDYMEANLQSIFEKTFVAQDGMEALPIIVSQLPQLIISDVTLPRLSGLELCRKAKQNQETNFIPFILLAPDMDELNAEDGYKTGADAYVIKPFDMDLLMAQVQNILNNRNIMRRHYLTTTEAGAVPKEKAAGHLEEQFVIHLNQVIADHLSDTALDVNMVAKLMRMSRASLYNKMKATIGTGVNECITKQRILYAQQLLTTTGLSIREISEKAGFLHQRNFSAIFKSSTGLSPSDYRKEKE